jgi:dienelactone hydrolase
MGRSKIVILLTLVTAVYLAGCSGTAPPVGSGGAGGAGGSGGGPTGQRYSVQSYTSGFADSPTFGAATIWYPTNAPTPLSGVIVVPGFTETQLRGWGSYLAARGFVTMTIDTNTTSDSPDQRSQALIAAVGVLRQENNRGGSPVQGKLDTNSFAIMGHSMGGGGTLIAANQNPAGVKAAIPLCPWDPGGSFGGIRVPTMIVAAENDILAGVTAQTRPFYASIPASTKKAYVEFAGADHFVANDPNTAGNGQTAGLYAHSWLEIFLHGDNSFAANIHSSTAFSQYGSTL